jgi:TP901 family phage tail tape measure protein
MSNVNFVVKVTGAQAIAQLNQAVATLGLNCVKTGLGAGTMTKTFQTTQTNVAALDAQLRKAVPSLNEVTKATKEHQNALVSTIGSYLRFRIAAGVFMEIQSAVQSATAAMKEYDLQTSRALRATGERGNQRGIAGAELQYGAAVSGRSIKDVGEVNYQLSTFIPDVTTRVSAFNDAMKLLVGTQGDARETTRLLIQLYAQFGDQMSSNLTPAQKLHGISEMIATAFKDANAEVGELAQSLKYLGPTAVAARVPLEQVMGLITALTGEGQRGRVSGTGASAILVNLIKKYNDDLKGVVVGDYVYKFNKIFFTDGPNKGMLDMVSTIKEIADIARHLPTAEADKFITAVGGSNQAIRILGAAESQTAIHNITVEVERMAWAAHQDKGALEALDAQMKTTFDVKAARAWNGVINEVTAEFSTLLAKVLGVKDGLDGLNAAFARLSKQRLDTQLQQRELMTETPGLHAERISEFATQLRGMRGMRPSPGVITGWGQAAGPNVDFGATVLEIRAMYHDLAQQEASRAAGWRPGGLLGAKEYMQFGPPARAYQIDQDMQQRFQRYENLINTMVAAMRDQGVPLASGGRITQGVLDQFLGKLDAVMRLHPPSSERPDNGAGTLPGFGQMYIDPSDPTANMTWALHHVKTPAALKREAAQRAAAARKALEEQIKAASEVKAKLDEQLREIMEDNDVDIANQLKAITEPWRIATFKLAALKKDQRTIQQMQSGHDVLSQDKAKVGDALIGDAQALRKTMFSYYLDLDPNDPKLDALAKTIDAVDYRSAQQSRDPHRLATMFDAQHKGSVKELQDAREKGKKDTDLPSGETDPYDRIIKRHLEQITLQYQTALGDNELGVGYGMGIDPQAQRRGLLQRNAAATAGRLQSLQALRVFEGGKEDNKLETEIAAAAKELNKFAYELSKLDADEAIKKFSESLSLVEKRTAQSRFELGLQGGRAAGQSEDSYRRQQFGPLQGELQIALRNQQGVIDAYAKRGSQAYTPEEQRAKDDAMQRASNEVSTAVHNLSTAINEEYNRKYDAAHSSIEGSVQGAILDFAHGRKGAGSALGSIANQFFDAALLKTLKPFTDPLVGALSQQLVAVKENTKSVNALTQTMGGTAPNNTATGGTLGGSPGRIGDVGTVIGATAALATIFGATAKGTPSFAPTWDSPIFDPSQTPGRVSGFPGSGAYKAAGGMPTGNFSGKGWGKAGTYLGYGMAAIGAFEAGQQGGPLTGAVSGALAGASFGPIGAAVGGVVGLLGGLFGGHHHTPQQDQRDKNPGLFNSPSDFVYDAYRYRATGQYPTAGSLGMTGGAFNGGPAVIINHFSDGVKTATTKALANAVSLGVSGQANHTVDIHSPV